jgi:hypothetical protein
MSVARRYGWLAAIAVAYLYIFPYFPKLGSANELPRVYLVKAMVHHHTFAIDDGVARWGTTLDVSASGDHLYSNKAPGSSMLVVPIYAAVSAVFGEPDLETSVWLCRVAMGVIPTLLFLLLLHRFLERFAPDPAIRTLVVVAYALGSMAMTYSVLYFSHQLAAACVGTSWIVLLDVLDGKRRARATILAGFLAGLALLVDYQGVFAVIPVASHAVYRLRRDLPQLARVTALAIAGAAVPIAVLLAYHDACFGSPWRTGYDASTSFAMFHQVGFLGLDRPRWEAFRGSLFAFDNGLFTLSPWLLLAISGANEMIRRPRNDGDRGIAFACVGVALVYIVFISSINFWRGGGAVGPRYITAIVPFLLPLVAAHLQTLRGRPQFLGAIAGSILVGVFIYTLSSATFPYWPESVKNPVRDITIQLLVDDHVGPNVGDIFGLHGVAGIVPYMAIVFGLTGWAIHRVAARRGLLLAIGICVAMLGAYLLVPGGTPNYEYDYVRDLLRP